MNPTDPFQNKLARHGLSGDDLTFLYGKMTRSPAFVAAHDDVVNERNASAELFVLLEGWACHYRILSDGRRQLGRILLAGDFLNLDVIAGGDLTVNVLALTPCRIGAMARDDLHKAMAKRPALRNMVFGLLVEENKSLIEQVVGLGRRSARERTAYMLCQLLTRLQENGEALDGNMRCALTQTDMADHLGLSTVHTNRALQDLKAKGLIGGRGSTYTIADRHALMAAAGN
jgi:CRP-like cAMP-binding protein